MKIKLIRLLALMLICSMVFGTSVSSMAVSTTEDEMAPYASYYLGDYTAWAVRSSNHEVYVYYDVTA
ncbi:MAG: hypothetical protein IKB65_00525, partial [Ruminiclostridium sp.]|nr:hypothetical protein [Ruminiclostridium sp.]